MVFWYKKLVRVGLQETNIFLGRINKAHLESDTTEPFTHGLPLEQNRIVESGTSQKDPFQANPWARVLARI